MQSNPAQGVRKCMWTPEEDMLLRKCIHTFGEGKWHLVPLRAGLNRCRKSCRLRWLNYLKPNIRRGQFSNDEVDLIGRLHKLLGNRWSLIAGRLPGRTSNDVKNFWNSRIGKKVGRARVQKAITRSNIVRPRPWTFSVLRSGTGPVAGNPNTSSDETQPRSLCHVADECTRWWCNLLEMADAQTDAACYLNSQGEADHSDDFTDFSVDLDIWKLLSFGEEGS